MTRLFNAPEAFVTEALEGFALAHRDRIQRIDGGVVRSSGVGPGSVAVVIGGGSGHYPAFAGLVGPGLAAGAVCGNLFSSPSSAQVVRVARAVDAGAGVLFSFGNYAGDVMHFGLAAEQLAAAGIESRTVLVTDDIASAPVVEERRGIAGDLVVFKISGSAAEAGCDLDEVERLARSANSRTRSIGAAFAGPTFPGAQHPLFEIPSGMLSLGLGIHGEPGISDYPMLPAHDLAVLLVERVLADRPAGAGSTVAVLLNGLGAIGDEELFVVYRSVHRLLETAGLSIVAPRVGELVTSLDMAGISLTLVWLDDELEHHWTSPADAPGFRSGGPLAPEQSRPTIVPFPPPSPTMPSSPSTSAREQAGAVLARELIATALGAVEAHEQLLGELDSVAGDGDHGVGMRRGLVAALEAATAVVETGGSPDAVLSHAGDAWSDRAGGTSGALWGAFLHALAPAVGAGTGIVRTEQLALAVRGSLDAIRALGGAEPGDKTMVDAIGPFVDALEQAARDDRPIGDALASAALAARSAADATAELTPRKGRARPLAARSLGSPDPGAISFAIIVAAIARAVRP